ncbi:four helix bundle protein [Planctomicrobium sp. SH661]|uniref:four helix bundle protein n=1 Tax=Planctomicrobium sp. SH661 TaxID=3448124 RepID=UPI003F5BB34A
MAGSIRSHRDLVAWQKAIVLVTSAYRISQEFPASEQFGLTQQLRRAAVSVAANVAEGKGRGTKNEFVRFLNIANGSLTELDTHFVIAHELGYISKATLEEAVNGVGEVGRIITGLRKSLEA